MPTRQPSNHSHLIATKEQANMGLENWFPMLFNIKLLSLALDIHNSHIFKEIFIIILIFKSIIF